MKMKLLIILTLMALYPTTVFALTFESNYDSRFSGNRTLQDNIDQYIDVPKGALSWHVLGATKEIDIRTKDKNGYDLEYQKPGFKKDVLALNGKEIKIKGFMFPLGPTDDQKLFLFGPFPITCPFHYHVGPSLVMEVHAASPIKFSYDPVILTGKLELVKEDQDNSTFYRLQDAQVVKCLVPLCNG